MRIDVPNGPFGERGIFESPDPGGTYVGRDYSGNWFLDSAGTRVTLNAAEIETLIRLCTENGLTNT